MNHGKAYKELLEAETTRSSYNARLQQLYRQKKIHKSQLYRLLHMSRGRFDRCLDQGSFTTGELLKIFGFLKSGK